MRKGLIIILSSIFLLAGCGQGNIVRYDSGNQNSKSAQVNVNQTQVNTNLNVNTNVPAKYVPPDLGMYQGLEYPINVKSSSLKNIDVVLNKITIVDKDFGRFFKLHKGMTPDADQVKFVIADYTITAKADTNLKDYSSYITYYGGLYDVGTIENTPFEDSQRFGFYPSDTDFPMLKGETKNIKIVYEVMQSMLSKTDINLWIQQGNSQEDFDRAAKFDITKYVK